MIQALLILLALASAGAGLQTWRLASLQADVLEAQAAQAENTLLRERSARAGQGVLDARARKETDDYLDRAAAARAAAADVDAGVRGVLDALAHRPGRAAGDADPACRAAEERAALADRLLAESLPLLAEGAAGAGRAVSKLDGLQGFQRAGRLELGLGQLKAAGP